MESAFEENPFNPHALTISSEGAGYLMSAAKWGKLLAIIGFVMIVLTVLFAFFAPNYFSPMMQDMRQEGFSAGAGFLTVFYLLVSLLYFFPVLYLYRFSAKLQTALQLHSEADAAIAFKNLKSLFKYMGIMTIIAFGIYALSLIAMVVGYGIGNAL